MPRQIHQILPYLTYSDAIGNLALELRHLFQEWGYPSEIFAENWDRRLAKECHSYLEYGRYSRADNLLILHYSTGGETNRFVLDVPDQIVVYYHNITPPHYFDRVNGMLAQSLREARRDIEHLVHRAPAICDSPYNRQELEKMGFQILGVVPPILTFDHLDGTRNTLGQEKHGATDWLHVGRLAPNKCIHDIIKTFYYYHIRIASRSRLFLVGSWEGLEPYVNDLRQLIARLDLGESIMLTGRVDSLVEFYRMADVYLSMSEHEGFCIPLIEAMYFDLPVLAYASTGVPATLGDAGVLIQHKAYPVIAEMVHEIIADEKLRGRLIQNQRARLAAFAPDVVRAQLRACLDLAFRL
jgi:glycosyltransferase involved in cell wall biosynthesis